MKEQHTENALANNAYLTGRQHWNLLTPDSMATGFGYFQEAIEHDPEFALPWAGIADYYCLLNWLGIRPPQEVMPLAKAAALKALELDDNLAQAHCALGFCQMIHEYDWAAAEPSLQRASELDPANGDSQFWHVSFLVAQGRFDEAEALGVRIFQADPLSPISGLMQAMICYYSRRYEQVVRISLETLAKIPNHATVLMLLGLSYAGLKRSAEAISALEQAVAASGHTAAVVSALGMACAQAGERDRARALLKELTDREYVQSAYVAVILTALGETEQAFAWLQRAYNERQGFLIFLNVEPAFDPLRSDPRLAALLNLMRLA